MCSTFAAIYRHQEGRKRGTLHARVYEIQFALAALGIAHVCECVWGEISVESFVGETGFLRSSRSRFWNRIKLK